MYWESRIVLRELNCIKFYFEKHDRIVNISNIFSIDYSLIHWFAFETLMMSWNQRFSFLGRKIHLSWFHDIVKIWFMFTTPLELLIISCCIELQLEKINFHSKTCLYKKARYMFLLAQRYYYVKRSIRKQLIHYCYLSNNRYVSWPRNAEFRSRISHVCYSKQNREIVFFLHFQAIQGYFNQE